MSRVPVLFSSAMACGLLFLAASPAFCEIPIQSKRMTEVEVITWLSELPRTLVVTADQRLIFSIKPTKAIPYHVLQLRGDGKLEPYPNKEWSGSMKSDGVGLNDVVALECDDQGRLAIGDRASATSPGRLIVWDMNANKLVRVFKLPQPKNRTERSVLQNIIVDRKHKMIVALSVEADKKVGYTKPLIYVLKADQTGENAVPFRLPDLDPQQLEAAAPADAAAIKEGLPKAQADLNIPMAIDPDCEWIYTGWPNKQVLVRIRAEDLANPDIPQSQLKSLVQVLGQKPVADSMAADNNGIVYFADRGKNGIGMFNIQRQYRMMAIDKILSVPTFIRLGLDDYLYVVVNTREAGAASGTIDTLQPQFLIARHKKSAMK
jgi:hypothetical protein